MRSYYKGPFIDFFLMRFKKTVRNLKHKQDYSKNQVLTLRSRRSTILPFLENVALKVYNGQHYIWVSTKLHHIGEKVGDFVLVKKKCNPKLKKPTINKKK